MYGNRNAINPIVQFVDFEGFVVWGQKTLQRRPTALDRVNVRRLMFVIEKRIRSASRQLLFDPHDDILRQDYDAAEALIDAIENKLGYGDFAVRLREEVASSRKRTLEEKIDAAVARLTGMIDSHDWARAFREVQRLLEMFPGNPKVESLPARVTKARNDHKRALLQTYGEAVRVNNIDKSIELLKELDLYLTPQEAAALQESARGVFRTKLHNLGVQFSIFVSDEQWADALATGQQIVEEFPNSRMATEVREKLELLRTRAANAASRQQAKQP